MTKGEDPHRDQPVQKRGELQNSGGHPKVTENEDLNRDPLIWVKELL